MSWLTATRVPPVPPSDPLPLAPLLAWCAARGINQSDLARRGWEVNSRVRHRGLSPQLADKVAVRILHAHPAEIWGAAWFDPEGSAA